MEIYRTMKQAGRIALALLGFIISIAFILSLLAIVGIFIYNIFSESPYIPYSLLFIGAFCWVVLFFMIGGLSVDTEYMSLGFEVLLESVLSFVIRLKKLFVPHSDEKISKSKVEEIKRMAEPEKTIKSIIEIKPNSLRELFKKNHPIKKIICPHCLKSILINDLDAICPFCDTIFSGKTDNVLDVLLNKCPKCDGKIKMYQCVYCRNYVDLFAPYDEAELERKRYEP